MPKALIKNVGSKDYSSISELKEDFNYTPSLTFFDSGNRIRAIVLVNAGDIASDYPTAQITQKNLLMELFQELNDKQKKQFLEKVMKSSSNLRFEIKGGTTQNTKISRWKLLEAIRKYFRKKEWFSAHELERRLPNVDYRNPYTITQKLNNLNQSGWLKKTNDPQEKIDLVGEQYSTLENIYQRASKFKDFLEEHESFKKEDNEYR